MSPAAAPRPDWLSPNTQGQRRAMREGLISLFARLDRELRQAGIAFTNEGYPVFPETMLLHTPPADMADWNHRRSVDTPTALTIPVMFMDDMSIIRRLQHLDRDLAEYRRFMGVGGFDLSPRLDDDPVLQRFSIILSMMATIWLGLHGIPILPNWRIGDERTLPAMDAYPRGSLFAVGTLGCSHGDASRGLELARMKLARNPPDRLLLYGPLTPAVRRLLEETGTRYTAFREYRRRSYDKTIHDGRRR